MRLQPIVYTPNMGAAVDWYAMVIGVDPAYRSDVWTSFVIGDATLALHRVDEVPTGSQRVSLSLVVNEPLDDLVDRLSRSGVEPDRGIQDETFGRSIVLRDPDGTAIQVNEHDH